MDNKNCISYHMVYSPEESMYIIYGRDERGMLHTVFSNVNIPYFAFSVANFYRDKEGRLPINGGIYERENYRLVAESAANSVSISEPLRPLTKWEVKRLCKHVNKILREREREKRGEIKKKG